MVDKNIGDKLLLQVMIFSTRPGRVGLPIGQWAFEQALTDERFDVELIDLKEINLPFFDEPNHPRFGNYEHDHTKKWSDLVKKADAYIFVVPEYNFGYSAVFKNAIDFLHSEWYYKPVAFVSYGGVSGGTRAVQMIKQIVTTVKMMPIFESIYIPFVTNFIKDDKFIPVQEHLDTFILMMDEIFKVGTSFKDLRGSN